MMRDVSARIIDFAEGLKRTNLAATDYTQSYRLRRNPGMDLDVVEVDIKTTYTICNLNKLSHEVRPRLDVEEWELPTFDECVVVANPGTLSEYRQVLKGAELVGASERPRVVRGIGPMAVIVQGEEAVVSWKYRTVRPVADRDCVSFGNVTVGPVVVKFEPNPEFVMSVESYSAHEDIDNGWQWNGVFLPEQHVNVCWRLIEIEGIRDQEGKLVAGAV